MSKMKPNTKFLTLSINQAEIIKNLIEDALEELQKEEVQKMIGHIKTIIIEYPEE